MRFCDTCQRGGCDADRLREGIDRGPEARASARCAAHPWLRENLEEKISGTRGCLAARDELLAYARGGDVIVVWKFDRLGRSLRDLIDVVTGLGDRDVGLRSLREAIDTTSAAGRLTFHIFAALAQFEAEVLRERTLAGLDAARRRGRRLGRSPSLTDEQIEMARTLLSNPNSPRGRSPSSAASIAPPSIETCAAGPYARPSQSVARRSRHRHCRQSRGRQGWPRARPAAASPPGGSGPRRGGYARLP